MWSCVDKKCIKLGTSDGDNNLCAVTIICKIRPWTVRHQRCVINLNIFTVASLSDYSYDFTNV